MSISSRVCPQCGNALGRDEENCTICGSHIVPLADEGQGNRYSSFLPPDGFMQTLQSGKRPRLLLMAGLAILLIIILGGSIFAISRTGRSGASLTKHGTATATGDAMTPVVPLKPLFSDNFADNSKGWGIGSGKGFSSSIEHNTLSMTEANHRVLDIPIPGGNNAPALFSDFSVTASFTLLKADANDSVGLYVRGASTNGNFKQGYFVDIYGDNSFDIFKVFADASKDTFLVDPTPSTFINPLGQLNKLTVEMKGAEMMVLINDKVLLSVRDKDYMSGQIALFVENGKSSSGVQALFSNVIVNPAPNKFPST